MNLKKICMTVAVITWLLSPDIVMAVKPKPFNRVVVIIDSSGTFRNHQYEALQKMQGLMEKIAEKKERRYQEPDEIYLISLDSRPEVIWYGKKRQLEQLSKKKLSEILGARRAYSNCTDITKAFNLASQKLNREPFPAAKWLFVFSDLIDEPPVSENDCKAPSRPSFPPESIRWDTLIDGNTSIGVFWAPDDQIQAWETSLSDLGANIRFYNAAEAENAELPVPAKARFKMTEEERVAKIDKIKGFGSGLGGFFWGILKYGTIIIGGLFALIYFRNRTGRVALNGNRDSNTRNNQNQTNQKRGR